MGPAEAAERLLIVSSDGHVGAPVAHYRGYVDPKHRCDFEDWLAQYVPLWAATQAKDPGLPETLSEDYKRAWMQQAKVAEGAEGTWNPTRRLASLDAEGVALDVLFPDDQSANSPPFLWFAREYNRRWDQEYSPELKLAGARAYNRWLVDFCSTAPERLLGLALIGSLADVDRAVEEVRWAKANGITGGVLLPLVYYNNVEPFWNDRRYDPLWAACAELEMPIHTHTGSGCPYYGDQPEAPILFALECTYWPHRPLWFLIVGGVLERHPGLKLVLTEQGSMWVREALFMMDHQVSDPKYAFGARGHLPLKPSEYFERQCWLGSSLVSRPEIEARHVIGVKKMMWGWDYPHIESRDWLTPRENLRKVLQGVPEPEVRAILAGNALEAYGLDLGKLEPIAARIGPRVEEIVAA
ncbi:amidohydrolase family protein [Phenylobacterium sp. LjRoot219]|uniref:amidohydrolase family protein n=1 Tax=Phenylobacterium sp. LjRoot219 TaxID=3342283 RepID=UPI003ECEC9DB